MSRFVRQSSYRHTFGTPAKKEKVYDNIKISASAWDTNLVSASAKYIAVNYQSSGGGAFLVNPLESTGKLPDLFPLCRAHTAPVLDTAWSPFNDSLVASAGEDGRVAITSIPDGLFDLAWSGEEAPDLEPSAKLNAHQRKAGHVLWHPTADGMLASASTEVKLWDVEKGVSTSLSETHADMVQSLSFDFTGSTYATTCKDKKLRLFDARGSTAAVTVADSHSGVKGSRVEWLGSLDRIVTTGFSRTSERQVFLWDSRALEKGPLKTITIDQSSGTLMPFWNASNNILFLAGKGDGNIRYYEYENDELFYLTEYSSSAPQRGMTFLPPRAVDFQNCEVGRAFKAVGTMIEPISFVVPRKSDAFQADLFPPVASATAPLDAASWLSGKTATPILVSLEDGSQSAAPAPKPTPAPAPAPAPAAVPTPKAASPAPSPAAATPAAAPATPKQVSRDPSPVPTPVEAQKETAKINGNSDDEKLKAELASVKDENEKLKAEIAKRDAAVKSLEAKLDKVRQALA